MSDTDRAKGVLYAQCIKELSLALWTMVSSVLWLIARRESREWRTVATVIGDEFDKLVVELDKRKLQPPPVEQSTRWLN